MTSARAQNPAKSQGGGGSNGMLLELVDRILDKGIVIDAWARVSVLSIELLTVEARVVVASVDTYLRYAEAIGNTALASMPHPQSAQQTFGAAQGQQQGQVGGQQAGGQQPQALPAPQQQNLMSNLAQQRQAQPQPAQQPQQAQPQPQQMQPQPQQMQPNQAQPQPQAPQQQPQQQVNQQPGT